MVPILQQGIRLSSKGDKSFSTVNKTKLFSDLRRQNTDCLLTYLWGETMLVCSFDLILYILVNKFSVMSGCG